MCRIWIHHLKETQTSLLLMGALTCTNRHTTENRDSAAYVSVASKILKFDFLILFVFPMAILCRGRAPTYGTISEINSIYSEPGKLRLLAMLCNFNLI